MSVQIAVLGGLVGGAAMVAVLYPMIWAMPNQFNMNFLLIVGTMMVPVGAAAYGIGFAIHGMMSIVFGIVHGSLIETTGATSVGAGLGLGALFGLGHAAIAGVMLGLMPMMHPRMRPLQPKLIPAGMGFHPSPDEELLDPPGFFGINYPLPTVMGFVALHVMFGLIVGALYAGLA